MKQDIEFLKPNFERLGPHVLATLLPEVKDPDLRAALFANTSLQPDLLGEVLRNLEIPEELPNVVFPEKEKLKTIFDTERSELLLRVGCAWEANLLATVVTEGTLKLADADISREIIKAALKYRKIAPAATKETVPNRKDLEAQGTACLGCWFDNLPAPFSILCKLQISGSCAVANKSERNRRNQVCNVVIEDIHNEVAAR